MTTPQFCYLHSKFSGGRQSFEWHTTAGVSCAACPGMGETHSQQMHGVKDVLQGRIRPIFLPTVYSFFYILSKYMYMLCNAHNLETNKMLYSWFVSLFLLYFLMVMISFLLWQNSHLHAVSDRPVCADWINNSRWANNREYSQDVAMRVILVGEAGRIVNWV